MKVILIETKTYLLTYSLYFREDCYIIQVNREARHRAYVILDLMYLMKFL